MFEKTDIYDYEVPGIGERFADPLALRRRLLVGSSGRLWAWAKQAKAIEKELALIQPGDESEEAVAIIADRSTQLATIEGDIVRAGYFAFEFPPIDANNGFGVSESIVLEIVYDYLRWLEGKDGRSESSGTSSPTGESFPDR